MVAVVEAAATVPAVFAVARVAATARAIAQVIARAIAQATARLIAPAIAAIRLATASQFPTVLLRPTVRRFRPAATRP